MAGQPERNYPNLPVVGLWDCRACEGIGIEGIPLLSKEGWLRASKKWPRSLTGAAGVVLIRHTTTPAAPWGRGHPSLERRGMPSIPIHSKDPHSSFGRCGAAHICYPLRQHFTRGWDTTMRRLFSAALISVALAALTAAAQEPVDRAMLARIKDEGLQRSRARDLYFALTDGIGARLTGSPSHMQAARWAQARFAEFGLGNARLEPFAFPRGWSLEKISVEMTVPRYMPLIAYAEAWTPSPSGVLSSRVVYIGNKTPAEVEAMAEQLRGAIVLTTLPQTEF